MKNSILFRKPIILMVVTICVFSFATKAQITINGSGSYATITAAVAAAVPNDIIQVPAGTYNEQVDVNKSITIRGNNYGTAGFAARGAESIVDGDNGLHSCFLVNADDVVIDGFTIQRGSSDGPGVDYESGVWFNTSQSGAQLINNIITDCQKGVYPNCSGPSYIKHNLFDGNNRPGPAGGVAIYTFSSDGLTIEDNEIKGQTTNAAVIFDGNGPHSNLIFTKNYLHDNDPGSSGVYCLKINGGSFTQNRITGLATRHLKFAGDNSNIDVLNNSFENNVVGIKVTTDTYSDNSDIRIHDNSFTGITVFAIENENPFAIDATCNWYGSTVPATIAALISGSVNYITWLSSGVDNMPASIGFQPAPNTCSGCPSGNVVQNTNTLEFFCSIQAAIDDPQTLDGHIITASAGTYPENVVVNKEVSLLGANAGIDARIIGHVGPARGPESIIEGGLVSAPVNITKNNVTINGFTIQGGQNGLNAGVYMDPGKQNMQILNNVITNNAIGIYANCSGTSSIYRNYFNGNNLSGPSGGTGIYSENTNSLIIDQNEFAYHTENNPVLFAATGPGVHNNLMFTQNNLHDNEFGIFSLSISNGSFSSNIISTMNTTGGATDLTFGGACTGVSVTNNFFMGGLRGVRVVDFGFGYGDNANISINDNSFGPYTEFSIGNLGGYIGPVNATCNWYGSTNSATIASKISGNVTYVPYLLNGTDNSPATGFQPVPNSCTGGIPKLTASINGVTVSANNDGNNDAGSFAVCNTATNILFNAYTDQNGLADPLLKVYQTYTASNVTVPFCNNCSASMAAFAGATGTAALINPALSGTLTMTFRSWIDTNNDGNVDPSEPASDLIVYTITVNPLPTVSFNIGASSVVSSNNGLVDLSESAAVTVCDGGTYTVANVVNSSASNRYTISVTPSGGGLLFNGSPAGNGDISAAQFSAVVGSYTITLSNPAIGGSLVQVITPYNDVNASGSYDAGDCLGEPITITYTAYPIPNAVATPSSQTIASGAAISTIVLSGNVSGTIYNWTRNNAATVTGIPASGSGNISGVLTNTTIAPVTVTFTITPTANGCTGTPVTATVTVGAVAPACVITCPPNKTVNNSWDKCGAHVSYPPATTTGSCGTLTYSKPSGSYFTVGTTTVTVTSSTGASCTFTVTVLDKEKPDIICPPDITVYASGNTCSKVVNFTVTAKDNCPGVTVTTIPASGTVFLVGTTTVTAIATDAAGNQTTNTFKVKVKENQPPVININTAANPIVLLWPANGSYQTINVSQLVNSVSDNCSTIPVSSVKITKVTSDEAENAWGDADGNTYKDIKIADNCKSVDLRRERKSTGNGRVYTIYLSVNDASGNTGTAIFKVIAPITQTGTTAVTDATAYTVSSNCSGYNHKPGAETQESPVTKITIPEGFVMEQNFPNPFSAVTTIRYALPVEAKVSLGVYNQLGQRVAQLTEGRMGAGYHQARFDATKLAAGIYLYRLLAVDADGKPFVITKKMVVAK